MFNEMGKYEILSMKSSALFGAVYVALDKITQEYVAIKTADINLARNHTTLTGHIVPEEPLKEGHVHKLLCRFSHKNILYLKEDFKIDGTYYLVYEYCQNGDLFEVISEKGVLSLSESKNYFSQLVCAVQHMHSHNICHRDISLENILITSNGSCKLSDFGLATSSLSCTSKVGKDMYMAPEVYYASSSSPYNPFTSDIWSLGIVLFIMITGAPPFEEPSVSNHRFQFTLQSKSILELIKLLKLEFYFKDPLVLDLIIQLLEVDPNKRPNIETIASHPWFTSNSKHYELDVASPTSVCNI